MSADEAKKEAPKQEVPAAPLNWKKGFWILLGTIVFLGLLCIGLPWLVFLYLDRRAKRRSGSLQQQAYHRFMAATYYLNQVGYQREQRTSLQFARDVVDPAFKTSFTAFMNTYLKTKYSSQPLDAGDEQVIRTFYPEVISQVRRQIPAGTRMARFMNIYRMVQYFAAPKLKR